MLSNPPAVGALHTRHRQHRRQRSTPTAFEAAKIASIPRQQQRPPVSHRRGLSLDTRRHQLSPTTATTTTRQDFTMVSTSTTNSPGSSTTPQHVLRETQQQRPAHPGPGQPPFTSNNKHTADDNSEHFLLSPHGTPNHQRFLDAMAYQGHVQDMGGTTFDRYLGASNPMVKRGGYVQEVDPTNRGQDFELFAPNSALSTPTFVHFSDESPISPHPGWISEGETSATNSRRTSRRISNGIMDRVAKFEHMGHGLDVRPVTPSEQNVNSYMPPTPMETPHDRFAKHAQQQQQHQRNRFSEGYDESMEETIKPMRAKSSSQRNSGVFDEMRQHAEALVQLPRSNTAPMLYPNQQDFMNLSNLSAEFVKMQHSFDGLPSASLVISPDLSQHSSPMTPLLASFGPGGANGGLFDHRPDFHPPDMSLQKTGYPPHPLQSSSARSSPSRRGSPHRRTESLASVASAASIASINIEETKTETGVTLDEIAAYIEGPNPADGKWTCLFEDCGKKFGRKENIKSHVQTHLNDRQYRCPSCRKCFVRQHDLKRHAKIHTGIKPYPCECGNSFARHDALTRHRQRGMCIGAFEGIVRKVVKRGRPRKHRPDMDERLDKSERTRRKNRGSSATGPASTSSASSQSGYSDSSAVNSPGGDFDGMVDDEPFPDILDVAMAGSAQLGLPISSATMTHAHELAMAPIPTLENHAGDPPLAVVSPEQIHSPSAASHYSRASRGSVSGDTALPASPAKSVASHYTYQAPGTPPELSLSSSPPATGTTSRFFDMDPNSSGLSDLSIGLGTTMAAHAAAAAVAVTTCGGNGGVVGMGGVPVSMPGMGIDEEMLLFAGEDGLVQLDRDMMLGAKYDEDYDAVAMFTNGDDVFFGSS